jgi:putative heme-binding domain-containing protein
MYRAVIEHPEWIPDDWEKRLDLRAGSEQGRIYRVYPAHQKPRPIPRLDKLDTAQLVAALDSPSGWQRDTAQRLLAHRRDPGAVAPLRALALATKRPKARAQAIWTLVEIHGLDEPSLLAGLDDPDPRVRAAVVPAFSSMGPSKMIADTLIRLADDPDAHVRFQVALALGNIDDWRGGEALAKLVKRDGNDSWMRAAVLSSARRHVDTLLLALCRDNAGGLGSSAPFTAMIKPLLTMSLKEQAPMEALTRQITVAAGQGGRYAPWQFSTLAVLLDFNDRARVPADSNPDRTFASVWSAARRVVADDSTPEPERIGAVQLIGLGARQETKDRDRLIALLRPQTSLSLQQAALAALGATKDPKLADRLLVGWKGYSPSIKNAVLDLVLTRRAWTSSLLSSLEDGCVPPAEIDPARRQNLVRRGDPLGTRAEAVFSHENKPRQTVIDAYRSALALPGDQAAGATVFKKLCASCHRFGNVGAEVGPDLATLNDKSPEALLIAILDPNRALEAKFTNFSIATVDGRVLYGVIAAESATAVTLRRQEAKEDVLLRSQIAEMTASGQSLMPEGLDKDLTPRDLADLIAHLSSAGPARTSGK